MAVCLATILVACKEDDGVPYTYTSRVDVSGASVSGDKYQMILLFSTDGGTTYTDAPPLAVGKSYKVKVLNSHTGEDLINSTFYEVDWSASKPAPKNVAEGVAEFTLGKTNEVVAKVLDKLCPLNPGEFADGSAWLGDEGTVAYYVNGVFKQNFNGSTDLSKFTQDTSNPNKIWISNIFGDGQAQTAYMILSPATNFFNQTVTIPEQETEEGGLFAGSGTYDQCRQTLSLEVTYSFGPETYAWTYNFEKGPYCAYDASSWLGDWIGAEGVNTRSCGSNFNGSNDANTIRADGTIANRFIMNNFWGDGVDAYFDMNPATNYWAQTITLPAQVTSEGGSIAASTGTFDQCAGTFKITCHYTIGGCTYNWTYNFHR